VGDLLVRNIPDAVKQNLIARANKSGRSLSDEAKHVIAKGLATEERKPAENSGKDFADSLLSLFADIPDEEKQLFSEIMDEIEEQRKKDFGRPFSFEE
jgi:plasmid stability protein